MARPSDGFTVALLEGVPPLVGARCPRCGQVSTYPLVLPRATPVATLTKAMGHAADVAAVLHTCPEHPPAGAT